MSRRARHKAPHQCCHHLHDLEVAQGDIKIMSGLIERINGEKDRLERQVRMLRAELTGETVTEELSVAQIRAQMRRTAPEAVPVTTVEGRTMLLPVGRSNRSRRVRPVPSWVRGEAAI